MLAQLVDADPGTFEAFIVVALVLLIIAFVLTIAKNAAATVVTLLGWCVFVASYLWLT